MMKKRTLWLAITIAIATTLAIPGQAWAKGGKGYTITTAPRSISETLDFMETREIAVTFVSQENLTDIDIWVTPSLREYVSVDPDHFATIAAGETNGYTITLNTHQDDFPGWHEGTIHYRQGSRTIAKPVPVEMEIFYTNAVPYETTKFISSTTADMLDCANSSVSNLVFLGTPQEIINLQPNDVVIIGESECTPYGYIGKVLSVTVENGETVVKTGFANLQDAFEQLSIDYSYKYSEAEVIEAMLANDGIMLAAAQTKSYSGLEFTIGHTFNTDYGDVTATGSLTFSPELDLSVKMDWFSVEKVKFDVAIDSTATIDFHYDLQLNKEGDKIKIATLPLPGFWVSAVYIKPDVTLYAGYNGTITTEFGFGVTQTLSFDAGCDYENGTWSARPPDEDDFPEYDPYYDPPTAAFEVRGYLQPELAILIYGMVGPTAGLQGFIRAESIIDSTGYDLDVYAGIAAVLGIKGQVFGHDLIDFDATVMEYEQNLTDGDDPIILMEEDFEDDAVGTWPTGWVKDANAHASASNGIRQDPMPGAPANNVLRLYGSVGGCWGALAYYPCTFPEQFTVECDMYNGSEYLSGCHPARGQIGLKSGTHWSNPGRSLLLFKNDGTIGVGWGDALTAYESHKWYHVKATYTRVGTDLNIQYWIDGEYVGEHNEIIADLSRELSMSQFMFVAQEGSTYIDNIVIYH
jgi:hypothetical protein